MIRQSFLLKTAVFTSLLISQAAYAEEDVPAPSSAWDMRLGIGALTNPEFNGANEFEVIPVPLVDITWRERLFLNTENGAGVWLFYNEDDPEYSLGASVGFNFDDRDFGDDPQFEGLGEVDGTVEAHILGGFELGFIEFEADAAFAISDQGHNGILITFGAGTGVPLGRRAFFEVTPFAVWADADYTQSLYGVSAEEAAASAFEEFVPSSGFERVGAEFEFSYALTKRIGVFTGVEYSFLLGDAGDSPFIEKESQVEILSGLFWRF